MWYGNIGCGQTALQETKGFQALERWPSGPRSFRLLFMLAGLSIRRASRVIGFMPRLGKCDAAA